MVRVTILDEKRENRPNRGFKRAETAVAENRRVPTRYDYNTHSTPHTNRKDGYWRVRKDGSYANQHNQNTYLNPNRTMKQPNFSRGQLGNRALQYNGGAMPSRRRRPRGGGGGSKQAHDSVAFLNPFEVVPDMDRRWPDSFAGQSGIYRTVDRGTIVKGGTDTPTPTAAARFKVGPNTVVGQATYTADADGLPVTAWGATSTAHSEVLASADRFRVCSYGVRLYVSGQSDSIAGELTIKENVGDPVIVAPSTPSGHSSGEDSVYALHPGFELIWLAKPLSHNVMNFNDASAATDVQNEWTYLSVFATDLNAATALKFETVMFIETLPEAESVLARHSEVGAKSDPGFLAGIMNAARAMDSQYNVTGQIGGAVGRTVTQFALNKVRQHLGPRQSYRQIDW